MAVAFEGERGDLGPVLFVFDIEVDPAVVAGVLGDFEAFVFFSALARGADPEGELEAAGEVVGGGENFGAGLPGGRAEAGAAGGCGEREQDRIEFFEDGLGRLAFERVDFFWAEFSRGWRDAECFRQGARSNSAGAVRVYASRTCSQTVDQARPLSSSMPSQPEGPT